MAYNSSLSTDLGGIQRGLTTIALCSLRDCLCIKNCTFRDSAMRLMILTTLRLIDGHQSVAQGAALCGVADLLRTNLPQFLVLLRRKNGLHLRIALLMNASELLHLLHF